MVSRWGLPGSRGQSFSVGDGLFSILKRKDPYSHLAMCNVCV